MQIMSNINNNTHIPNLRFSGFEGEWEEKPLSFFLHEHKTKSDGKSEVHSVSVSKGVINQVEYLGRSFAASDTSKYNLAKPNDIIYTKSPTGAFPYGIVKQNKNPYNVIVSPLYAVYTPINKHIGYIIDSIFESPVATNNYLSSLVQKGAKNTIQISNDTFISKSVCLPTNPAEQKMIASCLLEIDKLISAQEQKVVVLKEKKKGLMQQLLPLPGETTPRLRFPGFTSEWEVKPLSHFLHEHKTKSDGKCEVHSVSVTKGVVNQVEYLGRSFAASDTSKYNLAKPGDIIYTKSPTGSFPYGIVKQNKNPYNVIVSPLYAVYTPVNQYVGYILDSYFESSVNTNNYLSSLIQKGAKNTIQISNDAFVSKSVCLPMIPAEQQKIAECLESLDSLITAETKKLESLKSLKKGLMQQLFPQPNK